MIIGTTPTHTFTIPIDVSQIADLRISYAQDNNVLLTKSLEDCVLKSKTISVTLTQEDTLKFNSSTQIKTQLKILTTKNVVLVSKISVLLVDECLNKEVLTNATNS